MILQIKIPDEVTIGDLTLIAGAITKASTEFVDWDAMAEGKATAGEGAGISLPALVLMSIATQVERAVAT